MAGPTGVTEGVDVDADVAKPPERGEHHDVGSATTRLKALFARDIPDAKLVAQLIARFPNQQSAMLTWLHSTVGNGYVQSVVVALGASSSTMYSASIQLNPNAAPPPPVSPIPNVTGADLESRAEKIQAQDLLKSTDLASGENARKAMEILISIDDSNRGRMIDELDDKAFENLIDRVPDHERERFSKLVSVSKRPERKMLLWAAFHKARAENDVARYKGDAGKDAPLHKTKDDEGKDAWEADEDEKAELEAGYTKAQKLNRRRAAREGRRFDKRRGRRRGQAANCEGEDGKAHVGRC